MKVAPNVVVLLRDSEGFSSAIYGALRPNSSSIPALREESFELSLNHYGIKDHKASGSVTHYLDDKGLFQVSVLLLQNYEPPILACAVNEVLTQIAGEDSSSFPMPTLVVPFVVATSKLKWERKNFTKNEVKDLLYGMQIGQETGITHDMAAKTQKLPKSLQIHDEPLACFHHLLRVLNLPAFVIVGQIRRSLNDKTSGEELQTLHEIGELLASSLSLRFSSHSIVWSPSETSKGSEEPWRALYG